MCVCAHTHLWRPVEGVGVENRLDHNESLGQVLPVEVVPVVGALVRAVVEDLQERRTPQVEHELGTEKKSVSPASLSLNPRRLRGRST